MTKKNKKLVLLIMAAVLLVTTVAIYMVWNQPHKNVKNAAATEIAAIELYNIFTTDSIKAKSLYIGKVVQVPGEVSRLSMNQEGQQVIFLKSAVDGAFINCTMEESVSGIAPADKVIIKGICSGYIAGDMDMGLPGDVFLIRGYIINR
jgi:hypothetical protein